MKIYKKGIDLAWLQSEVEAYARFEIKSLFDLAENSYQIMLFMNF